MKLRRFAIPAAIFLCEVIAQLPAQEPPPSSELLRNSNGANDTFAAVGRLQGALTCTGSFIDPSDSAAPDARAWLLTAGHCISLEPYGVIRSQPSSASIQFNYFIDTTEKRFTVRARATGWSSMKGVDIALVELDATLGDLLAKGIRPLRVSSAAPAAGRSVFWTGIPGSPIPPDMQFLRRGRCTLGPRVQLLEGPWIWNDEISNNCPDLYAGASGSPLFDAISGEIIGVIGTGTLLNFEEGPDYDCQRNRPCVIRAGGTVMQKDTSYASPVRGIGPCFDQANTLDLQRPGCSLDPGFQLTVNSGSTEVQPVVDGKPAAWNAALSGNQRYYAYKHFPMGQGDCADTSGYSAPIPVAAAPMIADPVGQEDDYYFLCVIAGDTPSFDKSWQQPLYASARFKRLDSQPPMVMVDYQVEPLLNAYRLTNTTGADQTSGLGLVLVKSGPSPGIDCSDPNGYRAQISIPQVVRTSDMPLRVCWKISDRAGNYADPVAFEFGSPAMLPNATRNAASLARGTVAAGGGFQVDTFNLTDVTEFSAVPVETLAGVRMSVLDASGRPLPAGLMTAGPLFLQGVMPDSAAPGPATVIVQPPRGPALSQPVTIRPTAPGLYYDIGSGIPLGYASDANGNLFPLFICVNNRGCSMTNLPVSSTPGGLDVVLYGTGVRAAGGRVRMHIGTHTLDGVGIAPHPDFAGVDELHFHIPQDFPLRLYQSIAAETQDGASNYLWIYLE